MAYHTVARDNDMNPYTTINDWMVDSGCSTHMTPYLSDFIGTLTDHKSTVETANGGIIPVFKKGTVKVLIVDAFDPQHVIPVLMENVLYVPGLNKRLLSVSDWNNCGGQISFLFDRCRIEILNDRDEVTHSIDIDPPFVYDYIPSDRDAAQHIRKAITYASSETSPTAQSQEEHQSQEEKLPQEESPATDILQQTQPPTRKVQTVPSSLLHRRLAHRSVSALTLGSEDGLWSDIKIDLDKDDVCETCRITSIRKANRGRNRLESSDDPKPGDMLMVDIVENPSKEGLTLKTHYKYYLTVTDVATRFFVPMGMKHKDASTALDALASYAASYGPSTEFNLSSILRLHGDHDSAFTSEQFKELEQKYLIKLTFAAPRHQEQNGIHESNWQRIRALAFSMMNAAQVPMKFFDMALEHAWKVHAVLPNKHLTQANGAVRCPLGAFLNKPVSISRFRVLFCPVVMMPGPITVTKHGDSHVFHRGNEPQRGFRGIFVGLPRHSAGYLVYTPSTNKIYKNLDVYFDEDFRSTLAYGPGRFPGSFNLLATNARDAEDDINQDYTGDALIFCETKLDQDEPYQVFAKPTTAEVYDEDNSEPDKWVVKEILDHEGPLTRRDEHYKGTPYNFQLLWYNDETTWEPLRNLLIDLPLMLSEYAVQHDLINLPAFASLQQYVSHPDPTLPASPSRSQEEHTDDSPASTDNSEDDNDDMPPLVQRENEAPDSDDEDELPPLVDTKTHRYPTRNRHINRIWQAFATAATDPVDADHVPLEQPETIISEALRDYQHDVLEAIKDPTEFQPAPDTWKHMTKLPPHIRKHWVASLRKELNELIKKSTFKLGEQPNEDDPIIPTTTKFRTKLDPDGLIDKLKSRIALRGDMMRDDVDMPDTWCPIAGFRALKIFLAFVALYKQRAYQLDYVAAFLQAAVIGRKFTTLPKEWAELFPDLKQWFGVPLLLQRSLYGDRVANLAWDETQSQWLTSEEIGCKRLSTEGSIYIKRTGKDTLMILNAVDDQLYFSTSTELRLWFEAKTQERFDVQLLGQANWYLQSRITQHADYSVTLDQARYAALIASRHLPPVAISDITDAKKAHFAAPLPVSATFTKEDCSENYCEVLKLEREFGFEYAAAVGSLIYLINTFIKLNFAVRKLARFMQKPGRKHFKYLKHLLQHIQFHRCSGGIKFYADVTKSPLHQAMVDSDAKNMMDFPIIALSDSSFQDCEDTGRSTGGYLIFYMGAVIDAAAVVPPIVTNSTGEAEYTTAALCIMACAFVRKIVNEILGKPIDAHLTIPLGLDSKAAIDIANSPKETKKTRHIARRYHYFRWNVETGATRLFTVSGIANWSNSLTKVLSAERLEQETRVYQVEVPP